MVGDFVEHLGSRLSQLTWNTHVSPGKCLAMLEILAACTNTFGRLLRVGPGPVLLHTFRLHGKSLVFD